VATDRYDAVVVGGGPAGSTAALVLARGGARVALVDKAGFPRDKACGDLIGPRGVQILDDLGLDVGTAARVGDLLLVGPTGRRVVLPARSGRTYPGHGLAVPRGRFDATLRAAALGAGAEDVAGRVGGVDVATGTLALDGGTTLVGDVVIGADGATSAVAEAAGLVDPSRVLWGFATRAYVEAEVDLPAIALWDERPRRAFPGYGWLFPGPEGANVGLGLGLGADRRLARRATEAFEGFCDHLRSTGLLGRDVDTGGRRLGGWLKMGVVGTTPARGGVLLVGDAAGLVNPLQGEGIASALWSGRAAADAVLAGPAGAAARYRAEVRRTHGSYLSATTPIHAAVFDAPRVFSALGRGLTAPGIGRAIAPAWGTFWNDLVDGGARHPATWAAAGVQRLGRLVTTPMAVRRQLDRDLGGPAGG
jgi:geranylgeranyl reductase family protein